MRHFLRSLLSGSPGVESEIARIHRLEESFAGSCDTELKVADRSDLLEVVALTMVAAQRVLGQRMYDVQLQGALALARGRIAEMQTGEGKTLAAVPAVAWFAREGAGVHVMTVNDYLARRDAAWMGDVYRLLGLSVGHIQQGMSAAERRAAYGCDVTYATANEIGFDLLRDQLALEVDEQVHRPFSAALIDEADSILIDEARIPLVVAGGDETGEKLAAVANQVVAGMRPGWHYHADQLGRNVGLTDDGVRVVERFFGCGNLFEERNLRLHTAVQDALHAHALLRRDVDYIVRGGRVEPVDEFKGRVVLDRRWPAGLHTAIEAKEGVAAKPQGMILGSITLQNLVALYPRVAGMTGTAATQAGELHKLYSLEVEVIPTNRPVIREDHPDARFRTKDAKQRALVEQIQRLHERGQPVLVGTASVEESERLSGMLDGIPHQVLNARNDEAEAAVIARAGQRGAVTVSTNMAGRGTDIRLGEGVAELGGLFVIGTNRHESRRIDHQLRGRAGRQGDPGASRFFVSFEDDLMVRFAGLDPDFRQDPEAVQRIVEGANLEVREFLNKYEGVVEGQRQRIQELRQAWLEGRMEGGELERLVWLRTIDDLWADHLARVADLKAGVHYFSMGGREPLHEYLTRVHAWFQELEQELPGEVERRVAEAEAGGLDPRQRGAVWTYLTTDQPFGTMTERVMRGLMRKVRSKSVWG
jgi:preprotein translocase subunit SecA